MGDTESHSTAPLSSPSSAPPLATSGNGGPAEAAAGDGGTGGEQQQQQQHYLGYDMYPERSGDRVQYTWSQRLLHRQGLDAKERTRCEKNVAVCVKEALGVRLMMDALKASGCPVDLSRHISCESCDDMVTGGFDSVNNQIVVCQNRVAHHSLVGAVLMHEMIHMFDYCRNQLDFNNMQHLACTEVRAANLTHCSFISSVLMGDSSLFRIRDTHKTCVKDKAACSLVAARDITKEEACRVVDSVFDRCYGDLEPVGRRIRRNGTDLHRAYLERHKYGYV